MHFEGVLRTDVCLIPVGTLAVIPFIYHLLQQIMQFFFKLLSNMNSSLLGPRRQPFCFVFEIQRIYIIILFSNGLPMVCSPVTVDDGKTQQTGVERAGDVGREVFGESEDKESGEIG